VEDGQLEGSAPQFAVDPLPVRLGGRLRAHWCTV
jgi:hypothetical protein